VYKPTLTQALCPSVSLATSPASPVSKTSVVNLTAGTSCDIRDTPLYRFTVRPKGTSTFTMLSSGSSNQAQWDTTNVAPGFYTLRADVYRNGSTTIDSFKEVTYEVRDACTQITLGASPASPEPAGMIVTLAASANCGTDTPEYDFSFRPSGGTTWTSIRGFGPSTLDWNTYGQLAGTFDVRVRVRKVNTTSIAAYSISYSLETPVASPCAGAQIIPHIPYGSDPSQFLDLHMPTASSSTPQPLIMFIHGGGWHDGETTLQSGAQRLLCPLIS
jgi:hypothetical protein